MAACLVTTQQPITEIIIAYISHRYAQQKRKGCLNSINSSHGEPNRCQLLTQDDMKIASGSELDMQET